MQPIASLNALSHEEFAEALGPLFETAPPLADALYAKRPYASYEELIGTAEALVSEMPFADQVAVLSAHPRIGANPATLSALSAREQGTSDPPTVLQELARLNQEYEDRFGFRFVVFVNRRPKSEILEVLKRRLDNTREAELATGLHDMFLIARDRFGFSDSMLNRNVQADQDDPARLAVLEELRRRAIETYGEDRGAEATLKAALSAAATAVWRVNQEPLAPGSAEPLPTHD
jgi:OHCU decarboxylase